LKRYVLSALCLLAVPSVASADSFTADFLGLGHAQVVTTYKNGSAKTVWAGELIWNGNNPSPTAFDGDFFTYCVDLMTTLVDPQSFEVKSTDNLVPDGQQIAWLLNAKAQTIYASTATTANAMAAGLQLAIWNVLYDSDFTASGGNFWSSTATAVNYANQYLIELSGATPTQIASAQAVWLDTSKGQDQVAVSVPEPTTALLLGLGMFAAVRRRQAQ
jgi:hypothetical protein